MVTRHNVIKVMDDSEMKAFNNVPTDEGTTIFFSEEILIGIFLVLFQKWKWGEVEGESIIFSEYDAADLTDEELLILTRLSFLVSKESKMTLMRNKDGYTFVNFNFTE